LFPFSFFPCTEFVRLVLICTRRLLHEHAVRRRHRDEQWLLYRLRTARAREVQCISMPLNIELEWHPSFEHVSRRRKAASLDRLLSNMSAQLLRGHRVLNVPSRPVKGAQTTAAEAATRTKRLMKMMQQQQQQQQQHRLLPQRMSNLRQKKKKKKR
jgi:hypothetical protein